MTQVALRRILGVDDATEPGADGAQPGTGGDEVFDLVLGVVVQFVAAGSEDLDAVVGHRVVRRRDHHPEVGVIRAGQVRHRGGGEHPDPQRVDPLTGQSGDDGGLEHLAAGPWIAANHGDPAAQFARTRQAPRRRRTQRQRQLGGQLAIGDPANSVGAEKSTHADKPPTLMAWTYRLPILFWPKPSAFVRRHAAGLCIRFTVASRT